MTDQNSKWTADRIAHLALLVRHAWKLHGPNPGGGYFRAVTSVLPPDLDLELLREPLARLGIPFPEAPLEDSRYRGLGQIADA